MYKIAHKSETILCDRSFSLKALMDFTVFGINRNNKLVNKIHIKANSSVAV